MFKLKRLKKATLTAMLTFGILISSLCSVSAATSTQYFYSIVFDSINKQLVGSVASDSTSSKPENKLSQLNSVDKDFGLGDYANDSTTWLVNNNVLSTNKTVYVYTWPGDYSVAGNSLDGQRAEWVGNKLVASFNEGMTALKTLYPGNPFYPYSYFTLAFSFSDKVMSVSSDDYQDYTVYLKKNEAGAREEKTIKMKVPSTEELEEYGILESYFSNTSSQYAGMSRTDFVLLKVGDKEMLLYRSIPKGYEAGEQLSDLHSNLTNTRVKSLTFDHIVYQAANALNSNYSASNINQITQSDDTDAVTGLIATIGSAIISGLSTLLGAKDVTDLMFNIGTVNAGYYKGIAPDSWFSGANIISNVCFVMALGVMAFLILKMIFDRQREAYNPSVRANISERILSIFYVCILLVVFKYLFFVLAELNLSIVNIFYSLVKGQQTDLYFASVGSGIDNGIAAIIMIFIMFFLQIKINILYIVRSVVICMLYAFYPLFVVTLLLPGRAKESFTNWFKELIASMFTQSIHAAILAFFLLVTPTGGNGLTRIVVLMCFQPLTDMFRNIMGLQSGIEGIASGISGALTTAGAAVTAGAIKGLMTKEKGKTDQKTKDQNENENGQVSVNEKATEAMERAQESAGSSESLLGGLTSKFGSTVSTAGSVASTLGKGLAKGVAVAAMAGASMGVEHEANGRAAFLNGVAGWSTKGAVDDMQALWGELTHGNQDDEMNQLNEAVNAPMPTPYSAMRSTMAQRYDELAQAVEEKGGVEMDFDDVYDIQENAYSSHGEQTVFVKGNTNLHNICNSYYRNHGSHHDGGLPVGDTGVTLWKKTGNNGKASYSIASPGGSRFFDKSPLAIKNDDGKRTGWSAEVTDSSYFKALETMCK